MNIIRVNGKKYEVSGSNISIVGDKIIVGEESITIDTNTARKITVVWEGPAANVESVFNVNVQGDVQGNVNAGDEVVCGNVRGNVNAGDSITCGDITGNVNAGDTIKCNDINGDARAGDSVRAKVVHGKTYNS